MKTGIQTRLFITTSFVLAVCLSLTGYVLDRSFTASVLAGAEEQLRLVTYALMGAIDVQDGRVVTAQDLPDPRLTQPESGLYARVRLPELNHLWRSPSALTTEVDFPEQVVAFEPGEFRFSSMASAGDNSFYYLSHAVIWQAEENFTLTFTVATDNSEFRGAIAGFRRNLSVGLSAVALLFIAAQFAALRWGLAPLRRMADEVRELEAGQRQQISGGYPKELSPLAENLDRFIEHEQRSRTRYRNALEDLAHSLKTPLAVVRNALTGTTKQTNGSGLDAPLVQEQLDRMEATVHHQLSKASVRAPVVVGGQVPLLELLNRLNRALATAYVGRKLTVEIEVDQSLLVRGDEGDLMEIFGNLLENACKYTRTAVQVSAKTEGEQVTVCIDDDGPGIPAELREEVRSRGIRADVAESGQGIGLSVVAELVAAYHGQLEIFDSPLGGARLQVTLRAA